MTITIETKGTAVVAKWGDSVGAAASPAAAVAAWRECGVIGSDQLGGGGGSLARARCCSLSITLIAKI